MISCIVFAFLVAYAHAGALIAPAAHVSTVAEHTVSGAASAGGEYATYAAAPAVVAGSAYAHPAALYGAYGAPAIYGAPAVALGVPGAQASASESHTVSATTNVSPITYGYAGLPYSFAHPYNYGAVLLK